MRRHYGLSLPERIPARLELAASTRHASQVLEKSLKFSLNSATKCVAADGLAIKVERTRKALGRPEWDVSAMTQVNAVLVRYFPSMASPLLLRQAEAARALGRRWINVFLDQFAKHFGTESGLTAKIVERSA
jgi:hypothetical protein